MDNYDETRAVTIGKVFKSYDLLTKKSISRNNLVILLMMYYQATHTLEIVLV
jgi:hypothetical protein